MTETLTAKPWIVICKDCGKKPRSNSDDRCSECYEQFLYGEPGALGGEEEDDATGEPEGEQEPAVDPAVNRRLDDDLMNHRQEKAIKEDRERSGEKPPEQGDKAMNMKTAWKPSEDAILEEEWAKGLGAAKRAAARLDGRKPTSCTQRASKLGLKQGKAEKPSLAAAAGKKKQPGTPPHRGKPDGTHRTDEKPKKPPRAAPLAGIQSLSDIEITKEVAGAIEIALKIAGLDLEQHNARLGRVLFVKTADGKPVVELLVRGFEVAEVKLTV